MENVESSLQIQLEKNNGALMAVSGESVSADGHSRAEIENIVMRWHFIDKNLRFDFERMYHRNLKGQIKSGIIYHKDTELALSSDIESIVCEQNIFKESIILSDDEKTFIVKKDMSKMFFEAIKNEVKARNTKFYLEDFEVSIDSVINDVKDERFIFEDQDDHTANRMIAVITAENINKPIAIKRDFKNLVKICDDMKSFKVIEKERKKFVGKLRTEYKKMYSNEMDEKKKIIIGEVIKNPLPIYHAEKINTSILYVNEMIGRICCRSVSDEPIITLRKSIKLSDNGKSFTVKAKAGKRDQFLNIIENEYTNENKTDMSDAMKDAMKNVMQDEFVFGIPKKSIDKTDPINAKAIIEKMTYELVSDDYIKIKEEYKSLVSINKDGKTFKVNPFEKTSLGESSKESPEKSSENPYDDFMKKLKNNYKKEFTTEAEPNGKELPSHLEDIAKKLIKNPLPINSAIKTETARELAATSIVATYIHDPNTSLSEWKFGMPHVNIKQETYLSLQNTTFRDFIILDKVNQTYTVKREYRNDFIQAIKKQYESAIYLMHPDIEAAITEVIRNEIPTSAGIPGLHAEVLAVNNALIVKSIKIALIIYNEYFKDLRKHESPKLTAEKDAIVKAAVDKVISDMLIAYTHKFDNKQLKDQHATTGMGKSRLREFPACPNCRGILSQLCNVKVKTG